MGLNHTEDRIINYIYLKDNKFYSLGENILKCPERSHTETQRENTLKTQKWTSMSSVRFLFDDSKHTHKHTHTVNGMHGKVSL